MKCGKTMPLTVLFLSHQSRDVSLQELISSKHKLLKGGSADTKRDPKMSDFSE